MEGDGREKISRRDFYRRFCNVPLPPIPIQHPHVTSSDKFAPKQEDNQLDNVECNDLTNVGNNGSPESNEGYNGSQEPIDGDSGSPEHNNGVNGSSEPKDGDNRSPELFLDDNIDDPDYVYSSEHSDTDSENISEPPEDTGAVNETTGSEDIQPIRSTDFGEFKRNGERRKGNKKKDFCIYCETYVLNFSRHLTRNHSLESDIQKISALSPKNKDRKLLLTKIRNQGNFLNSNNIIKPIRRAIINTRLLPCTNCFGFFASKQLWRHRKLCLGSSDKAHQAKGQNLLLKNLRVDTNLREKIFPRMRADEISLTAKNDVIICAVGTRYLKTHPEKHLISVASHKMRELARLLIEVRKLKPSVKSMFDALTPQNFDILVEATKIISHYDNDKELYGSASTALNLGTAIKQCCQIAITFVLKRKQIYSTIPAAEAEADLKTLIQLIESEWRLEVSTRALKDLNTRKWNKVTMIPLATDLITLRNYLISKATSAVRDLQAQSDKEAYLILLETVFCRVLLLNRRRPGELQRLPLHIYEGMQENPQQYEEFSDVILPTEKVLLKHFKRVIIRGKRGRGVPVLFSVEIQEHIKILLKYRDKFLSKNNYYLFGHPNTVEPICGYKTLQKYAVLAGTKNPGAITATKLRKHLATLSQVLNMTESDIEQLSSFMGHTIGVHRGSYRLPNDVFQTAKLSKILLLMEKGEAAKFKGKTLDEINIDLEDNIVDSDSEVETEPLNESSQLSSRSRDNSPTLVPNSPIETVVDQENMEKKKVKLTKRKLVSWTENQKAVVRDFFRSHIKFSIAAKKSECLALKGKYPELLENKDWLKIKVFVQNEYVKKKKR